MTDTRPLGPTMRAWADARNNRREISQATHRGAHSHIRAITRHFGDQHPLAEVGETDMLDWFEELGVAPRSRNTMCGTYRGFFAFALRRRWIDVDPMAEIRNLPVPEQLPRLVPPVHVPAILGAADFRAEVLITVAVHLGLRRAELARLRVEDWDRSAGTLRVVGKGGRERMVPVEREPALALADWLRDGRTSGPMWPGRGGLSLSPGSIYRIMVEAAHQAGHHYSPHQYRHTTATVMMLDRVPVEVVRRQLGHRNLANLGIYTSANVEDIRPHVARVAYGRWGR